MGLPGSRTSLSGGRCAAWRSDTPAVETPFSSILWPRQAIERGVDDCAMEFPRSLDKKPARHSDHWHRSGAERAGSPLLEANAALYKDGSHAKRVTLVPWAIEEADAPLAIDQRERQEVFGRARLALLYSGSFGRAHSYNEILQLIENLSSQGAKLAFSVRGNRESELRKAAAKHGEEIRFVDFAKEDRLAARLSCADVHVVSLQPEWTGMVVPSKFFGALSAGRPVLFAGSRESSIARWIEAYNVGWVLNTENLTETVQQLRNYADSPQEQSAMQHRCFDAYQQNFSKRTQFEQWHQLLQSLLPPSPL